ncbi:ATP-grasp domain-containing protein [Chlamydiia bacterium]|jgi:acetyl-CoA carboxylase, biotin carboxylase subunit|nr:ATP-grasp domain-containing protein [Chlamydiia bacterium]
MIKKLLIANRGEIAYRIIRECQSRRLDYVLIYTEQEKNDFTVRLAAKHTFCIGQGGTAPYCDIFTIMAVCDITGCDAIHPGYGFLSENAMLAKSCEEMGITFVGPNSRCLSALGNKWKAKSLATHCGIPTLPGVLISKEDSNHALDYLFENKNTYWILKAVHGGGGKGCERIDYHVDVNRVVNDHRRRSMQRFGCSDLMLEQYLPRSKHVEIQVIRDVCGNTVVFPERDGSIQRSYQKIIEESPSPLVSQSLRRILQGYTKRLFKQLDYVGLATVEFLLDETNNVYFIEVNPRLQVEHALTESICGINLVQKQLDIAAGQSVCFGDVLSVDKHSIEVRIYAEDTNKQYAPTAGQIKALQFPHGDGIRVETALDTGDYVWPCFDGLIAKIIITDQNRIGAITKLIDALDRVIIDGVTTNLDYLKSIVKHNDFITSTM